ncbi:hypothetical protein NKG05_09115 [Oerskovia sp. M15]
MHHTLAGRRVPERARRPHRGWRGPQSGTATEDVVLPARATTSLRVSVTIDDGVAAGTTGSVRYDLAVQGSGTLPTMPRPTQPT